MQKTAQRQPAGFIAPVLATLVAAAVLSACGGMEEPPKGPPVGLELEKIGGFTHAGGTSSAEITAFDPISQRLFVVNGALASIDVLDFSHPEAPTLITSIPASAFGTGLAAVNSVAVHNGIVALAIEASPKTAPGVVAWLRASDLQKLGTDTVGALPDMLTFTPDGRTLLVANEGEPDSYNQPNSQDPEGSISLIRLGKLKPDATRIERTVVTADFRAFNGEMQRLQAAGVRIYGPNATVAQDLEPEYIAVSDDGRTAWVTLQENNALAVVDVRTARVTAIKPLGFKNHNLAGMGMDVSDEDGGTNTNSGSPLIKIGPVPVKGMYLPDAIASFQAKGKTWLITANEGDARADWPGFNEETRVRAHCNLGLDPTVFSDAANQILDSNLGRLRITTAPNGNLTGKNAAGQCTELYSFGGRSFSIWSTDVQRVADSGEDFERLTTSLPNVPFNASNAADGTSLDNRSPTKGPEPEGVTVARFGPKTFAFIGLERVGGVAVYDVSEPAQPRRVSYLNTRDGVNGDRGPEGLTYIAADDSPTGEPLLVVGHETSGTTAVYRIRPTY